MSVALALIQAARSSPGLLALERPVYHMVRASGYCAVSLRSGQFPVSWRGQHHSEEAL